MAAKSEKYEDSGMVQGEDLKVGESFQDQIYIYIPSRSTSTPSPRGLPPAGAGAADKFICLGLFFAAFLAHRLSPFVIGLLRRSSI
jgi:hypothetical protein